MQSALAPALMTRYLPRLDHRIRAALLVLTGSLVVALMAQVRIPLPFTPVPITGQTFAVLLIGAAFGAVPGAACLALYLLEGLFGLPVFSGGASGLAALAGPTGGYLVGFIAAAYVIGRFAERGMDRRFWSALPIFLLGEVVIYALGVSWLALSIGWLKAIAAGLLPFLIGDAIKLVAAAAALPSAWKLAR